MKDRYIILTYTEQPNRPLKLFCKNDTLKERKSTDGTKFVVHCTVENCNCLDWIDGDKVFLSHSEIMTELNKPEWNEE